MRKLRGVGGTVGCDESEHRALLLRAAVDQVRIALDEVVAIPVEDARQAQRRPINLQPQVAGEIIACGENQLSIKLLLRLALILRS